MLRGKRKQRGIDEANIIRLLDDDETDAGMGSASSRRTTRQKTNGRASALYDMGYHPMDDSLWPNRARNHHHSVKIESSLPSLGSLRNSETIMTEYEYMKSAANGRGKSVNVEQVPEFEGNSTLRRKSLRVRRNTAPLVYDMRIHPRMLRCCIDYASFLINVKTEDGELRAIGAIHHRLSLPGNDEGASSDEESQLESTRNNLRTQDGAAVLLAHVGRDSSIGGLSEERSQSKRKETQDQSEPKVFDHVIVGQSLKTPVPQRTIRSVRGFGRFQTRTDIKDYLAPDLPPYNMGFEAALTTRQVTPSNAPILNVPNRASGLGEDIGNTTVPAPNGEYFDIDIDFSEFLDNETQSDEDDMPEVQSPTMNRKDDFIPENPKSAATRQVSRLEIKESSSDGLRVRMGINASSDSEQEFAVELEDTKTRAIRRSHPRIQEWASRMKRGPPQSLNDVPSVNDIPVSSVTTNTSARQPLLADSTAPVSSGTVISSVRTKPSQYSESSSPPSVGQPRPQYPFRRRHMAFSIHEDTTNASIEATSRLVRFRNVEEKENKTPAFLRG